MFSGACSKVTTTNITSSTTEFDPQIIFPTTPYTTHPIYCFGDLAGQRPFPLCTTWRCAKKTKDVTGRTRSLNNQVAVKGALDIGSR